MQRQRKQLLGLAGLALVGIMTAVACVISAPDAGAVSKSGDVNVRVQVKNPGTVPQVEIKDFTVAGTDSVFKKVFKVTVSYLRTTDLRVYLKNNGAAPFDGPSGAALFDIDPDAGEGELALDTSVCNVIFSETERTCELTYDLADADGSFYEPGTKFSTRAVAMNGGVESMADDELSFVYREAFLKSDGSTVSNGDPVLEAILSEDVKFAAIEVFDKDGNPVEIPANKEIDGKKYYTLDLSQKKGDSVKFALPLWEAGAAAGDYRVVLIAYDTETPTDGHMSGLVVADVTYTVKNPNKPGPSDPLDPNKPGGPNNPNTPDVPINPGKPTDPSKPDDPNNPDQPSKPGEPGNPEAPDTGLNLFRDLNISRADYIVTGLVAFGLVTGFAIFLIVRRNKR